MNSETNSSAEISQSLLGSIVESLPDYAAVVDRNGNILWINRPWTAPLCESDGGPEQVAVGVNYLDIVERVANAGNSKARYVLDGIRGVLDAGAESFSFEFPCRDDRGESWASLRVVPLAGGETGKFLISQRDIGESKRTEDALRRSYAELDGIARKNALDLRQLDENYRHILENMTDIFYRTNAEGRIVMASPSVGGVLGYEPEELLGTQLADLYADPEGRARFLKTLKESSGRVTDYEAVLRRRDGHEVWVSTNSQFVFDDDGKVIGVEGIARDITARKHAGMELETMRRQLVEAQRLAKIGSWELDLVSGILTWSDEVYSMFEIDPKRFGASYEAFLNAIHPDDREAVDRAYSQSLADRSPYSITHRLRMPDGRVKWVSERCESDFDADGTALVSRGIVQDITELQETETALRESEARYAFAIAGTRDGLWVWDYQNGEGYHSPRWKGILGYAEDELENVVENYWSLVHPEDRERVQEATRAHLEDKKPYDIEFRYLHKEGRTVWVRARGQATWDEAGAPLRMGGAISDITEAKLAEEAALRTETRLSDIFAIAPEAIVTTADDSRITLFNKGAERIFGYSADEVIGQPVHILIPERYHENHAVHMGDFLNSEESPRLGTMGREIFGRRKDGSEFPAAASLSKSEIGGEVLVTVMLHDTTERHRAEQERLEALKVAEKASLAKSEFMASMSHELRTPLNSILGFADMISGEYLGPIVNDQYVGYAENIAFSGRHLLDLVNQILDIERIEAGMFHLAKAEVRLTEILDECRRLLGKRIDEAGIQLSIDIPDDLPPVFADRRALFQVLVNILTNAIKYTARSGRLAVHATCDGDRTVIEVTDTGIGIPEDKLATIKEPFTRHQENPHAPPEGVGLGLAIANAIVDLHGGDLDIRSQLGQGTTVTISLPVETA